MSENHARVDDMGGAPPRGASASYEAETPEAEVDRWMDAQAEHDEADLAAQLVSWAESIDRRLEALAAHLSTVRTEVADIHQRAAVQTDATAEGFATVLARQRVQSDQLTEFQSMLAEFRPLLEVAQKRLGAPGSWRSKFGGAQLAGPT